MTRTSKWTPQKKINNPLGKWANNMKIYKANLGKVYTPQTSMFSINIYCRARGKLSF